MVEAVGAGVTDVAEGDRGMASFTSCGQCRTCLTGRPFNCEHFNECPVESDTPASVSTVSRVLPPTVTRVGRRDVTSGPVAVT